MKSKFERSVEWAVAVLFASFCLTMFAQILSRTFLNTSILWSEEYARYSFIWMVLLASGIALKRKAHMGFDLILMKLPLKARYVINIINDLLVGIFLVLLLTKGFNLLLSSGMTPSPTMHIPMGIVYVILPLSALIMLIFLLESLWNTIRFGLKEEEGNMDEEGGVSC